LRGGDDVRHLALALVLALIFAGSSLASSGFDVKMAKEGDDGKEFVLRAGDVLLVALPEVTTAGYSWEVAQLDGKLLSFLHSFPVKLSPQGAVGGVHLRIMAFKALSPGRSALLLTYGRPWDPTRRVERTFVLSVRVR